MTDELIVVVEDEKTIAELITDVLALGGHTTVMLFHDPRIALSRIAEGLTPQVIISDFHMPVMNGVEMLNAVRKNHPEFKGIIVTADPDAARAVSKAYPIVDKGDTRFFDVFLEHVARALKNT